MRLLMLVVAVSALVLPHVRTPRRLQSMVDGAECVESESCSVEELESLMKEVKAKAAEIKSLESKLTALNVKDSDTLKQMLAAEECELNGFDGCSAWYYS